jgi:fructose-bisphosphate aldolase class II
VTTASTRELLGLAAASGGAVPAFNVITLEHAEGVVAGLSRAGSTGILQVSERALLFHGEPHTPILAACARLIAAADVPIALHLDHIQDAALATALIDSAHEFDIASIMVDFASLDRDANVKSTREAVARAHQGGLFVEAELGEIGGKDGAHAHGARTDPDDAAEFVGETGVDALAVAIGSSHAMTSRTASLDLDLLARLASSVPVPLVLHGSSGVSDAELAAAISAGIRKVNVGTALTVAFTAAVRRVLDSNASVTDPRDYLREARDAVSDTVVEFCWVIESGANAEGGRQ